MSLKTVLISASAISVADVSTGVSAVKLAMMNKDDQEMYDRMRAISRQNKRERENSPQSQDSTQDTTQGRDGFVDYCVELEQRVTPAVIGKCYERIFEKGYARVIKNGESIKKTFDLSEQIQTLVSSKEEGQGQRYKLLLAATFACYGEVYGPIHNPSKMLNIIGCVISNYIQPLSTMKKGMVFTALKMLEKFEEMKQKKNGIFVKNCKQRACFAAYRKKQENLNAEFKTLQKLSKSLPKFSCNELVKETKMVFVGKKKQRKSGRYAQNRALLFQTNHFSRLRTIYYKDANHSVMNGSKQYK